MLPVVAQLEDITRPLALFFVEFSIASIG